MNSCILMAEIVQDPQLRYTPDNQTAVADMFVQFPGARAEDPPATLKVVGWRNLALEIQERCHKGDRIAIEGRLSMNTIERKDGFKEKYAELVAQKIHYLGANTEFETLDNVYNNTNNATAVSAPQSERPVTTPNGAGMAAQTPAFEPVAQPRTAAAPKTATMPAAAVSAPEADVDDIPF